MSPEQHDEVKKLFLEAIELSSEEQDVFLATILDDEIRKEVSSLVKSHVEDFTIEVEASHSQIQPTLPDKTKNSPKIAKLLFGNKYKLTTTLVLTTLIVLAAGIYTRIRIKDELVQIRKNELNNMIESNHLTMNVWIDEQQNLVDIISQSPKLNRSIHDLLTKYGQGKDGNPEIIWNDTTHQKLVDFLTPILKSEGIPLFSIIDKTGYRIATNEKSNLGGQLNTEGMSYLISVFTDQKITFTRPTLQRIYSTDASTSSVDAPITWIDAPIKDSSGKVIASLGLSYFADKGFSKFLNIQKAGKQGESYAFDRNGLLVSYSKYRSVLQQANIIGKNEKTILNTTLRNPGYNLRKKRKKPLNYASLPFVLPVANALAQIETDTPVQEIITNPYLNYIGQEVIGAYVWLPKYNFGIVTEIPASEAFSSLNNLTWTFSILFLLLFSLAIYSTLSSFSLFTIRNSANQEKIGPYFIKEKIGEGGMGDVFLTEHQLLKRPTAVKTIKASVANDKNIHRFEREVLLASKLTHPNTIKIYDFGKDQNNSFYFAMEYLEGINLSQLSNVCGMVPPERVCHILLQICYSLKEAHHKGLIHRDIKPQNIMLCYLGDMHDVVKVLDFGLVKDIEDENTEELTNMFEIGGTPMYMSPERLVAPQSVDYRTDIYSVGVIAYFLLTAQKPFLSGVTDIDLINQVINESPQKITAPNIPVELSKLIYRCMEKDPIQRPADMNEVIEELLKIHPHSWTQQKAEKWWSEKINFHLSID